MPALSPFNSTLYSPTMANQTTAEAVADLITYHFVVYIQDLEARQILNDGLYRLRVGEIESGYEDAATGKVELSFRPNPHILAEESPYGLFVCSIWPGLTTDSGPSSRTT